MRTLGNILWHFPFLGFITAFFTFLLGCILVILIITAPIGLGLIQLSKFYLLPFSYEMVSKKDMKKIENPIWKKFSFLIMILYLPFGILVALISVVQILFLCISIFGIPMAIVIAKALSTNLNPVNKICVPYGVGEALKRQKVEEYLSKK